MRVDESDQNRPHLHEDYGVRSLQTRQQQQQIAEKNSLDQSHYEPLLDEVHILDLLTQALEKLYIHSSIFLNINVSP